MEISLFSLPFNTSYRSLRNINGIKFTFREIDVIACIISGRGSTKTIASFLSIEPKTVEVHTRNIRLKLNGPSRENIVNFIEKEGKFSAARQHYLFLFMQQEFQKKLQIISSLVAKKKLSFLIIYEKKYEIFIEQLRKDFEYIGVKVTLKIKELGKPLRYYLKNIISEDFSHSIFIFSSLHFKELLIKKELKSRDFFLSLHSQQNFMLVSLEKECEVIFEEENIYINKNNTSFFKSENYYFSFFDLFNKLFPDVTLDNLVSEFREQYYTTFNNFSDKLLTEYTPNEKLIKYKEENFTNLFEIVKNNIHKVIYLNILFSCILAFNFFSLENSSSINKVIKSQTIRSDFSLPHDNVLLNRLQIVKQIDKKLTGNKNIKSIALVGIGGAGKSTLARQYANQQRADVVWEMNAETRESLISSFENLAYLLAKTEEEKKELKVLEEIKDLERKADRIISFTKEKLRALSSWFLVYDNVEKFADIQKYFPTDSKLWGKGKIIVTTRNNNISNNSYIHHTLTVGELTDDERLHLFLSIRNYDNPHPLSKKDKKNQKFLLNIPPFPLDISSAAYYLNTTNISYEKYIENLRNFGGDFSDLQEKLENDISGYTGSRYKIIVSAIKKIIEENKDFENILLLISLVDSQNIPRDLLDCFKNNALSEQFIYNLNKYCLITSRTYPYETISLHRSIQKIFLYYIYSQLCIKNDKEKIKHIVKIFEDYVINTSEGDNYDKIKNLVNHCNSFLNKEILPSDIKKNIYGNLGIIMYRLGYYTKAKNLLEKNLISLRKGDKNAYLHIALIMQYLGNVYGYLGNINKAEDFLEKSFVIYKNNLPKNDYRIAYVLLDMGLVNYRLGQYKKAKNLFEESLNIHKKQFSEDHFRIAWVSTHLGMIYGAIGYYEKAEDLFNKSLKIYKKHFEDNHIKTAWVLLHIGRLYNERGDYEKAKDLIEYALSVYKDNFSENDVSVTRIIANLGSVYANLGKYEKAKTFLKKSLILQEENFGKDNVLTAETSRELGKVYFLEGQVEIAEALINKSLIVFQKNNHPGSYVCLETLADIYNNKYIKMNSNGEDLKLQDLKEKFLSYLKDALKIVTIHFPSDSSHIKRIKSKISNFSLCSPSESVQVSVSTVKH